MLSKTFRKLGMVLAVVMAISTINKADVLASEKMKYGVAIKDGKLYSLEISGNEFKSELIDEEHPINKGYDGNRVMFSVYNSDGMEYAIFDRYGKKIEKINSKDYTAKLMSSRVGNGIQLDNYIIESGAMTSGNIEFGCFYLGSNGVVSGEVKYIYTNEVGLIPCQYDDVVFKNSSKDYLVVKKDGKLGVINKQGEEIIPCQHDEIKFLDRCLLEIRKNWKKQIYIIKNKDLIRYDDAKVVYNYPDKGTYILVKKNGKLGILSETGEEILAAEYDEINYSNSEGGFGQLHFEMNRVKKGGKCGYVDKQGKIVVPLKYENAEVFSSGLAKVGKPGDWSYIDKKGKQVLHFKYEQMGYYGDGLIAAASKGRWGYIDKKGNKVIDFKYDYAADFNGGVASVMNNWKKGLINKKGKMIYPCESEIYINFEEFNKEVANIMQGGKYGLINKKGKVVAECKYDERIHFNGGFYKGFADIIQNGKYGILNEKGKVIYPCKSAERITFYNGLATIKENGKYGIININGKVIYPCKSSRGIMLSKEPFIMIGEDDRYILKNRSGKIIYSGKDSLYFSPYMAVIKKDYDQDLILDSNGNKITAKDYDYAQLIEDDTAIVGVNKPGSSSRWDYMYGLIDGKGNEVIAPIYGQIEYIYRTGAYIINNNGKKGIFSSKGKQLLPIEYDYIYYIAF